jgi:hypothetical protein
MDEYGIEIDAEGKTWFSPNVAWKSEFTSMLLQRGITCLTLSYTNGWQGDDLSFLGALDSSIEHLRVIAWTVEDASQISNLRNLRTLRLKGGIRKGIDFSGLSKLEVCKMGWPDKAETIFDCTSLTELHISEFPGSKLDGLNKLWRLRTLILRDFKNLVELPDLKATVSLGSLELAAMKKLVSVDGLEHLLNLRRLELNQCKKLEDLSPVFRLSQLEILVLEDLADVATLKPLGDFKRLDYLNFVGTYPKDGDLSFLDSMESLKALRFENKRQFNRKRESFSAFHNKWDRNKELV